MTRNHQHTSLAKTLFFALLLLVTLTACERKDLWLRGSDVMIDIAVYDIHLDYIWGEDWHEKWQYDWDEEKYGKLGYSIPDYVQSYIYVLDGEEHERGSYFTKTFTSNGGRLSLKTNLWYDMLFYSANTEYILFDRDPNNDYYNVSTRASDVKAVISRGSEDENDPESEKYYENFKQPDELFGTFVEEIAVSSDPEMYEPVYDPQTEQTLYVHHMHADMEPYSFIYLLQVMVINNTDSVGQIVGIDRRDSAGKTVRYGASGLTITGLAKGANLFTRQTSRDAIAVSVDETGIRPMQWKDELILPDSTVTEGEIFATRMISWGLPNIAPLQEWDAVRSRASKTIYNDRNRVGIRFILRNGRSHVEAFDVTKQVREHPCGGVITIVFDPSDKVRPDELEESGDDDGAFKAEVKDWENKVDAHVTI